MAARGEMCNVILLTATVSIDPERLQVLAEIYTERARLLAHLSSLHESYFIRDNQDPDWPVVCIELPTGQFSCHISPEDMKFFDHVPFGLGKEWDGHTTAEKWQRLDDYVKVINHVR